jgi:predicted NAD/FAD-dependent oxidoreductase
MRTAKSIAVIGAGMAGLTCARHLQAAGHLVRVFEKSRGIGGRLATRRAGEARFDHGAQYFTARDPELLRDIATASRVGACAAWHAQIAPELARGFAIRAVDEPWFVGTPGMKDLLRSFAAELYVSYLTKVEALKREGSSWDLIANDGESLGKFDYVLITAPAPQTAALLPPGSALRFAVEQIMLLPCWALMLEYADNLPLATDAGQPDDEALAWLSYDTSKPDRPKDAHRWVLHATADWSVAQLLATPAMVTEVLLARLATLCNSPLPAPRRAIAHLWRYARVDNALGRDAEFDPNFGVGVAGDWCIGGRVEAAYLSGRALARRVLAHLAGGG